MNKIKPELIIFDLDGTIADTLWAIRDAINTTLKQFGFRELDYDGVRAGINYGARHLCEAVIPEEHRADEGLIDRFLAVYSAEYNKTYLDTHTPYEGLPEVMTELRRRGYRLAVLSNKPDEFVRNLAEQLFPVGTFDAAAGPTSNLITKPNPVLTESLIAKVSPDISPENCVMVGDSDIDILTGKNAGMTVISVAWGYRGREYLEKSGAEIIIDRPAELLNLFK